MFQALRTDCERAPRVLNGKPSGAAAPSRQPRVAIYWVMKVITDEARAAIARAWLDSSLSQPEFARQHGISPRTLRLYVQRHAGRHEERQVVAQDVGVDIKKLGEVGRLHERVDRLQAEVEALRALLVASQPDAAERQEPNVPARHDDLVADQAGPTGMENRHGMPAEPGQDEVDAPPSVGAGAAGQLVPLPVLTNPTALLPASGTPDEMSASRACQEPPVPRKRRGAFLTMLDDLDGEEPSQHDVAVEPTAAERHDTQHASEVQPTVTQAPESSEPASELILPVPMPRPGACWG